MTLINDDDDNNNNNDDRDVFYYFFSIMILLNWINWSTLQTALTISQETCYFDNTKDELKWL